MLFDQGLKAFLLLCLIFVVKIRAMEELLCQTPSDKHVDYVDVQIPMTEVPENMTTYVCYQENLPFNPDWSYQAIGFLPLIQNAEVMHHMIVFGCPERKNPWIRPGMEPQESENKPHACSGADGRCRTILVQWSRGIEGPICSPPEAGVPLGIGSPQSLLFQIHWNNEKMATGLTDNSGVRIFYTSKKRPYNLGNVQIGQNDLEIPPATKSTLQSGSCSSECTKEWLSHPIYLTRAHLHMHYLGAGGSMRLIRNGTDTIRVLEDESYNYDNPPAHYFDEPIEVLPGDEIEVTCNFNSLDGRRKRDKSVSWGEGSYGEMCYAFVSYYPKVQDFDQCIQFDKHDICLPNEDVTIGECIFPGFIHIFEASLGEEIIKHCTKLKELCSHQCMTAISEVTEHPCMQGRLGTKARREYLPQTSQWAQVKKIIDQQYHCSEY